MNNILVHSFIIHSRPFRETSMIYDVLTPNNGLISVLAKGIKKKKDRSHLQPTKELILSFTDSDFPILTSYEPASQTISLKNNQLIIVLYFNELIYRLVPRNEPQEILFNLYKNYIVKMSRLVDIDQGLILGFEALFLKEIGYELSMADNNITIKNDQIYFYDYDEGFKIALDSSNKDIVSGASLEYLFTNNFESITHISVFRRIIKNMINKISHGKTIKSYDFIN